ncbi:MAG: hypothetical protein HONDAALG_02872 [Gammaproteobacteria bacterium]|nr:hypothetical protein [Gammaproteobacteria bacterium]
MTEKDLLTKNEDDAFIAPDWLVHKLEVAGDYAAFTSDNQPAISERFRARAHQIAETLDKLRAEREKIGFVPMSIGDYIHGIAKVVNLSLSSTLNWLGISDICRPDPQSAGGFARLGLELGLSLSEILTHIRVAVADFAGSSPIPLLMARRRCGVPGGNDLQVCVSVLDDIEAKYDRSIIQDLRLIEDEIRAVYQQESQDA